MKKMLSLILAAVLLFALGGVGALAARIGIAVAKGILFGLVIPEILRGVRTVLSRGRK